eukprot:scaffold132542_cov21-Tisochrysis_lutea.AAC.1
MVSKFDIQQLKCADDSISDALLVPAHAHSQQPVQSPEKMAESFVRSLGKAEGWVLKENTKEHHIEITAEALDKITRERRNEINAEMESMQLEDDTLSSHNAVTGYERVTMQSLAMSEVTGQEKSDNVSKRIRLHKDKATHSSVSQQHAEQLQCTAQPSTTEAGRVKKLQEELNHAKAEVGPPAQLSVKNGMFQLHVAPT